MAEVWAGLVRVSSVGSRNGDSFHADEDQVADVERYGAQRGARIVFMEPELSVSGGKQISERPALQAAIEGVEAGEYDGIVVAYLSRLTRSRSGVEIWDRVEGAGGHVHCAQENLDTSTPSGRFIRDIHLANAVREREEHVDRFAERRRKTVEAGVWRQRQTPRGLTFKGPANEDGKFLGKARQLVPGPDANEVRQAFRDRGRGVSISELARRLKMTPTGVRKMLSNRVYLGELRDGTNVNPKAHKALVTVEVFEKAQRDIPRPARRIESQDPALLADLVRCAGCGHRMTRKTAATVLYACRATHGAEHCPAPAAIYQETLDQYVTPIALAELDRLRVSSSDGRSVQDAEAGVEAAERELGALLKTVTAAGLDERDFAGELRERKAAIEEARERLRVERARRPGLSLSGARGSKVWKSLNGAERNMLLRGLLKAVVVQRAGKGRRVPIEDRVRVLRLDAELELLETRRGEKAAGIVPIALPAADDPGVLG
jgi:DNA invertase Pin-like site-specific DNA recombinase